jgi:hypothetical protein
MASSEQVLLSDDLLNVMRGAVNYAVEYDAKFVAPPHLLLALLDDPKIGEQLSEPLERGRIIAAARQPQTGGVVEVSEGPLPRGETPPFQRYDTLVFQSTDGKNHRWLNKDVFKIFQESARRVDGGRFLPKHLAVGFVSEATSDRNIMQLLGRDPQVFTETVYGL